MCSMWVLKNSLNEEILFLGALKGLPVQEMLEGLCVSLLHPGCAHTVAPRFAVLVTALLLGLGPRQEPCMDPFATCLTETEAEGGASWWHRAGQAGLRETGLTSVGSRPSLCRAVRWGSVGMANGAGDPGQGVTLGPGKGARVCQVPAVYRLFHVLRSLTLNRLWPVGTGRQSQPGHRLCIWKGGRGNSCAQTGSWILGCPWRSYRTHQGW